MDKICKCPNNVSDTKNCVDFGMAYNHRQVEEEDKKTVMY